jgi:hypothetical protein
MAGYSGKPLAQKLGVKPGVTVAALNAPRHYRRLLRPLPVGAKIQPTLGRLAPFIHFFSKRRAELARRFPSFARALTPDGTLWVSWPKGTSGVATDLTEDVVRTIGLATGLVDVKVCAVDDVWSGLKFVRRLKDR